MSTLLSLDFIIAEARHLISAFLDPMLSTDKNRQMVSAFKPSIEDYHEVFIQDCAEQIHESYAALWDNPPPMTFAPQQNQLRIYGLWSDDLAYATHINKEFPGGCNQVAHLIKPAKAWIAWRFIEPGRTVGTAYDGLVFVHGRFVWFPKPWQILSHLLPTISPAHHLFMKQPTERIKRLN